MCFSCHSVLPRPVLSKNVTITFKKFHFKRKKSARPTSHDIYRQGANQNSSFCYSSTLTLPIDSYRLFIFRSCFSFHHVDVNESDLGRLVQVDCVVTRDVSLKECPFQQSRSRQGGDANGLGRTNGFSINGGSLCDHDSIKPDCLGKVEEQIVVPSGKLSQSRTPRGYQDIMKIKMDVILTCDNSNLCHRRVTHWR